MSSKLKRTTVLKRDTIVGMVAPERVSFSSSDEHPMSFLRNTKIRTKILSIILPICLVGIVGVLVVSTQFKNTVASYSDFITNDETAAVQMSRASQRVTALSYSAYQILVYSTKDPEMTKFLKDYADNKSVLLARLAAARQLVPAEAPALDKLTTQANEIIALTDPAVRAGMIDDNDTATRLLKQADPLIDTEVVGVRTWIDGFSKNIDSKSDLLTLSANTTVTYALYQSSLRLTLGIPKSGRI